MAKIKLKDIKEKILPKNELLQLLSTNETLITFLRKILEENEVKPITYDNFYDNGKEQTIYYCHNCGHSWTIEQRKTYNDYYPYSRWKRESEKETCPCCEKNLLVYKPNKPFVKNNCFALVRECNVEQGYALIDRIETSILVDNLDIPENLRCYNGENIDYLKGKIAITVETAYESLISIEYGIRPAMSFREYDSYGNTLYAPTATYFFLAKQNLKELSFIEDENYLLLKQMLEENTSKTGSINELLSEFDTAFEENKANKKPKPTSVKKDDDDLLINAVLPEVSTEDIQKFIKSKEIGKNKILSVIYSELAKTKKIASACLCGTFFDAEFENKELYDKEIKCPCCGQTRSVYNIRKSNADTETYYLIKYELLPDSTIIVGRIFHLNATFVYDKKELSFSLEETQRVFYSEKSVKIFHKQRTGWKKGRVTDLDSYSYRSLIVITSKEEFEIIVKNSDFKYSGLLEAVGLKDERLKIEDIGCISRNSFMYMWTKHKCLEQFVKTGMRSIVESAMRSPDVLESYNQNGSTIYEILNITKPVYMIAKSLNASPAELKNIKKMWNLEQSMTLQDYQAIKEIGRTDIVILLKEKFNIPFKKTLEYINSCYNNQCIEKGEALSIWYDYLRMAKDMEYKLKDNTIKYPSSLKKDHDRATFSYKVVKDKVNTKRFIENAETNSKRYNYSYGDYLIKVPMTPNEVIQEGTVQKHCVASYVSRIREGETAVCFARLKNDPETAYFTIEVKDDTVVQVKGYCNCAPKEEKFLAFLKKWAEAKDLRLRY